MKPWQNGIEIETLRAVAQLFREHDDGLILGAFTGVKERDVAAWMDEGKLVAVSDAQGPLAALVRQSPKVAVSVADFTGEAVAKVSPGAVQIKRLACRPGAEAALLELARATCGSGEAWLEGWLEHPTDRAVAEVLGFGLQAVKVMASSELVGVYLRGERETPRYDGPDHFTLARLRIPQLAVAELAQALEQRAPSFAQHYSNYNKAGAWTALSLAGYGGAGDFIIKPAEMSKDWKEKNPEKLEWKVSDSPLRALFPEAEPLIAAIPGVKQRIRLMRLEQGGGELTRHADIVDKEAGTAEGKLLRIHLPITTNPQVEFEMWNLAGDRVRAHMAAGEAWYLDTRKPHRAWNLGGTPRVHLVMDTYANPELLAMLEEASVVQPREARAPRPSLPPAPPQAPRPELPLPPGMVAPSWKVGDARSLEGFELLPPGPQFDLIFSCPPYFDLERYSQDPADLSNATGYASFLEGYRQAIRGACSRLKEDRFAVFVVGEIRDEAGYQRGFVKDTIDAFQAAGLRLYNEAVLLTALGSLPIRAGRIFAAGRKLGRTHQQVLVFVKGSAEAAVKACGPVDFREPEESEEAAAAEAARAG